ncbi:MAG: hypothetical protein HOV73_27930 [Streptomyces sp.]|nr:hypothetical protein [Streptomyces sp.]NUR66871.1 hypothetical protein [Streptomyces sp.]NUS27045.1 hypothetical protein [Streptomyces sp.]
MEYFVYCRDRADSLDLRRELTEDHWAFMDGYAEELIARGPTFPAEGDGVSGSMHIVDLPDAAAARTFAFEEPNYKAGVYRDVLIRRWRNSLGRTMWEYTGATAGFGRFLILAQGGADATADLALLDASQRRYLEDGYRDRLIAYGPLLGEDGVTWLGTALLVELADRAAAEALMADEPYARAGLYESVEIHDWEFGGRR